jgi:site-specific DNA-cytosine methylase
MQRLRGLKQLGVSEMTYVPTTHCRFEHSLGVAALAENLLREIKKKQPKAIFLENVKGLRNHDKGKTLATILNVLREDLDYYVPEPQILNAKEFGVPQNRERIFNPGYRKDLGVTLKGRAIRYKSSLVPRCGLFATIPNAA